MAKKTRRNGRTDGRKNKWADRIAPETVLPSYVEGISVKTESDLLFLGKANLTMFKKHWRRVERDLKRKLLGLDEAIAGLESATTPEGKRALAAQYDHPEFPVVMPTPNNAEKCLRPEPKDEASRSRRNGATTFNFCGWCKYARGGVKRCNYYITSKCALLGQGTDVNEFNTPCRVLKMSAAEIVGVVKHLKTQKWQMELQKSNVVAKLHYLSWLVRQAEEKPALPRCRSDVPFTVGEQVMCYLPRWDSIRQPWQRMFVSGTVVDTPERLNGWVTVRFEKQVSIARNGYKRVLDGYGVNIYVFGSLVMKMDEYEYLRTRDMHHWDYQRIWLKSCLGSADEEGREAIVDQMEDFEELVGPEG